MTMNNIATLANNIGWNTCWKFASSTNALPETTSRVIPSRCSACGSATERAEISILSDSSTSTAQV